MPPPLLDVVAAEIDWFPHPLCRARKPQAYIAIIITRYSITKFPQYISAVHYSTRPQVTRCALYSTYYNISVIHRRVCTSLFTVSYIGIALFSGASCLGITGGDADTCCWHLSAVTVLPLCPSEMFYHMYDDDERQLLPQPLLRTAYKK